jgi:hypothetical protein
MAKERLAIAFERLYLLEEALIQYDEAEAIFYQCLDSMMQKGMCVFLLIDHTKDVQPWTQNFGARDSMDDSASILSIDKKSYQEMLAQNSISVFDFRTYHFARQCHLLAALGQPVEICTRAKLFIAKLTRSMFDQQVFAATLILGAHGPIVASADFGFYRVVDLFHVA